MSLILEALRKSEAERRRGHAPGLHAELPPPATVTRRPVPAYAWILAAAVAALAIAAWIVSRSAPVAGSISEPAAGASHVAQRSVPTPTPATATATERADAAAAGYPDVERIAPPAVIPVPAQAETVAAAPTTDPAAQEASAPPAISNRPPEAARAAPVPPAPAARAAAIAPAPATGGRLPTVAELPAAERGQLPELKLTMHMWNERPALRFVILDGVRHGEGERVGAATITRIDAEGVVLDLNGRPVRLPLR